MADLIYKYWLKMRVITHVITTEPVAALTFDDGPDRVITPKVLDILKEYNAKGTFFVVGECAKSHPDIVRRVDSEGHAIGNHSWSHPPFTLILFLKQREQIKKADRA